MSKSSKTAVLIAGSGSSGLILAITLAKNGVPVRIIEKNPAFNVAQRGAGIQPRTLEVYRFLGVLPDMLKGGIPMMKRCMYEMPEGRKPAKIFEMVPPEDPTPLTPHRAPLLIGQGHTEEILRSHLAKYNVQVELNTELVSFEQDADGVTVHIVKRDGSEEHTEIVSADWLVGADGAKSTVRKQLGLTFLGETREENRMLLADIEIKGLSNEYWHSWGEYNAKVVYIRPTEYENVFSLIVSGQQVDFNLVSSSREALVEFVKEVTNRYDLEFGNMSDLSEWRPNIRMADKFGQGRVFIIGDAAHVHPPTGAQGLNSSVQDAFNLAWKLALVCKGLAGPSILESYTIERLPVIAEVLGRSTAVLEQVIKDREAGKPISVRPVVLHQLGVNCRWSPLVVDDQPEAKDVANVGAYLDHSIPLYAGDRAPDAPGLVLVGESATEKTTTALFDIYDPTRHTLLAFVPDAEKAKPILAAVRDYPEGTVAAVVIFSNDAQGVEAVDGAMLTVVDREGHAHAGYTPVSKGFPVIIVRPDGVVGAVVAGPEGIKRYFGTVFAQV